MQHYLGNLYGTVRYNTEECDLTEKAVHKTLGSPTLQCPMQH